MIAVLLFLLGICVGFVFGATAANRQIKQTTERAIKAGYMSIDGECFKIEKV